MRNRRAFTLIELLVVIAIIAILIGLLLPAVQKVREAAARMSCTNNLHQISIANMNYESTYKTFVPGIGKNGCCWGTWMVPILPFVEQDNLYRIYKNFGGLDASPGGPDANYPRYGTNSDPTAMTTPNGNRWVCSQRLKTFTCPSDSPQLWSTMTKHNYALNAGNTNLYQVNVPMGCTNPTIDGSSGCRLFGGAPFGWYERSNLVNDSTFPYNITQSNPDNGTMGRPRAIGDITDGTSNTMCVTEVIQGRSNDLRGFTWWGGAAGITTEFAPNSPFRDVHTGGICPAQDFPNLPRCTTTSTNVLARLGGARSYHTGGVNAAMCDGSVRFVRNSINIQAWRAMSTSQGGEVITDN
ncbi:MAG TPA: DUF1559 domain-containing protein [Gemmataceae bacterium]|nr:DUF1559 domain-containing protein [Gemmataceae bacterium]